jgi:hypothetical protein
MKLATKTVIVAVCILLCGTGAIVVSSPERILEPQKCNAVPVKNRDVNPRAWIQI